MGSPSLENPSPVNFSLNSASVWLTSTNLEPLAWEENEPGRPENDARCEWIELRGV